MKTREEINKLSKEVVDACFHVHKEMGPGLLESIYRHCLVKEFQLRGIKVLTEVLIPLSYKGYELPKDFRMDMLVEDEIMLELKSVEDINPILRLS